MNPKIDPVAEARKRRASLLKFRAWRKQKLIERCAKQALAAKTRLIEIGKGRNGFSMNKQLLDRHYAVR
jgi:hypothetical protein